MKIDNMREEHQEKLIKDAEKLAAAQKEKEKAKEPRKKVGFIAVSIGEGLRNLQRTWRGLHYRRWSDHEPEYGGYADSDRSCKCRLYLHSSE